MSLHTNSGLHLPRCALRPISQKRRRKGCSGTPNFRLRWIYTCLLYTSLQNFLFVWRTAFKKIADLQKLIGCAFADSDEFAPCDKGIFDVLIVPVRISDELIMGLSLIHISGANRANSRSVPSMRHAVFSIAWAAARSISASSIRRSA